MYPRSQSCGRTGRNTWMSPFSGSCPGNTFDSMALHTSDKWLHWLYNLNARGLYSSSIRWLPIPNFNFFRRIRVNHFRSMADIPLNMCTISVSISEQSNKKMVPSYKMIKYCTIFYDEYTHCFFHSAENGRQSYPNICSLRIQSMYQVQEIEFSSHRTLCLHNQLCFHINSSTGVLLGFLRWWPAPARIIFPVFSFECQMNHARYPFPGQKAAKMDRNSHPMRSNKKYVRNYVIFLLNFHLLK